MDQNAELFRLLRATEVAEATGESVQRVYALARSGALPCVRLGRAVRFSPPQVLEFIERGGTKDNG